MSYDEKGMKSGAPQSKEESLAVISREGNNDTANHHEQLSLEEYIENCLISEDDPGLLLSWTSTLESFVQNANGLLTAPAQPKWITTAPGQMTVFTFQQDVVNHLASVGGGSYGRVLVAPNNLVQYTNVIMLLRDVVVHPFVQAAMVGIPAGSFLANTAIIHDGTNVRGTPADCIPPLAPNRQVFG